MEIKFSSRLQRCLRRATDQIQTQEQTQEVRLPETMPDIGRVLGAWGSILVRSKQWYTGGMSVSGGVMAWVLYAPEDGSEPRSMETWIPFQLKWEFPETQRDGFIWAMPKLKGIDARSTSARKMILRANIGVWGQGLEPVEMEIYGPGEVPEDVQLRVEGYPMEMACESGEKTLQLEEAMPAPEGAEKILRYDLIPVITEQKVLSSRLAFRGKGIVKLLYQSGDKICAYTTELPFSQYADLDREYDSSAAAQISPILTNLEMELNQQQLQIKCAMAAQYVICDRVMVQLVEDAYSTSRPVELLTEQLSLPMALDERTETVEVAQTIPGDAQRIVEITCLTDHPQRRQEGDCVHVSLPGILQALYYDPAGNLQCAAVRFEEHLLLPADPTVGMDCFMTADAEPSSDISDQGMDISTQLQAHMHFYSKGGQPMVTGLQLGEMTEPDATRPSLILRRFADTSLWELAKDSGSTVEAILQANQIQSQPETGRMLLIPVI